MRVESIVLSNLIFNEEFTRRVIPFLKSEYFSDKPEKVLFEHVAKYIEKYNGNPTKETLLVEIDNDDKIDEKMFENVTSVLNDISFEKKDQEWLIDTTEKFCQDKAIFNAVRSSIQIIDGNDEQHDKGAIPALLSEALAVSFDDHIGHNYLDDYEQRYDFYHRVEEKIPFHLDYFNKITKGGFTRKTLNVFMGGTGSGKTMVMCDLAASNLMDGKNVLYITLEMAEERIAERIDANLLNVPLQDIENLSRDMFNGKIDKLKKKTVGKLIIKEYPTASVGAGHFRHLINDLFLKKNFKPDIIYIDYLNLCISSRLKFGTNVNSYSYVKAIAEELRGLGVEKDVVVVSATQLNRTGFTNSDPGLEDTAESFGLPATVDFMGVLITSDELEALGQMVFKQLKNRYNDMNIFKKFVFGVDRSRMRLFDVEQSAQNLSGEDKPLMDSTSFGERQNEDDSMKFLTKRAGKKDFSKLFN